MSSVGSFSGLASGVQWRDMIDQIMQVESRRKVAPIAQQITLQQRRRDAWNTFSGLMNGVAVAAASLRNGTAFGAFGVSVDRSSGAGRELLTASASAEAAPGTYSVEVRSLAQQEKLRSGTSFASTTQSLGSSGTFHVNGRAVTLDAGDTLATLRDKINAANTGTNRSGVTASIVSIGETEHYLTLTADHTGTRGIELVDGESSTASEGVLAQLGIVSSYQIANLADGATQSQRFGDRTTPLATVLGLTSPPAVTYIQVEGRRVQVDLLNDSLQEVLDRIQAAGSPAVLIMEQTGGGTMHRLSTGPVSVDDGADSDPAASQRVLELLGFVKPVPAEQIQAGANARVVIDGLTVERRTNIVAGVLEGVSLNLLSAEPGSMVTVSVARDLDAITGGVQNLATAFNRLVEFQAQQRRSAGPLANDPGIRGAIAGLKAVLLTEVPGLDRESTSFTRGAVAGVMLTRDGTLEVDAARLKEMLGSNFAEVRALFGATAHSTAPDLRSVLGSSTTNGGTYPVSISRVATVPSMAGTAWASPYPGGDADQMTVLDTFSGRTAVVDLLQGTTPATLVAALNARFQAESMSLVASQDGDGQLVISGTRYGSAAGFTIGYRQGGSEYHGAPPTGLAAGTYSGLDAEGTVGGEPATGSGQFLTAAAGTAAAGLSFRYTGSALGAVGSVSYGRGLAGELERVAESYTRSGDGLIASYLDGLDRSIQSLERRRSAAEARLDSHETRLIRQFTIMEAAMGKVQAQGAWLSQQITALQSSWGGSRR